jgi:hypothetical protein
MEHPEPPKRKPVRTSAAQVRDFSLTGFQVIDELASYGISKTEDKEAKRIMQLIADCASNFAKSL